MFRRRRGGGADDEAVDPQEILDDADDSDDEDAEADSESPQEPAYDRSGGPFDAAEEFPEANRIDFGGLQVLGVDGMQLSADAAPDGGQILSVTARLGGGTVQVQGFAAPRAEPLWPELRAELLGVLAAEGSEPAEQDGTFGRELAARALTTGPDGRQTRMNVVFAGIDGPRWMLRLIYTGAGATDPQVREQLDAVVRGTVVVRGTDPMSPRELIPLHLPGESAGWTKTRA